MKTGLCQPAKFVVPKTWRQGQRWRYKYSNCVTPVAAVVETGGVCSESASSASMDPYQTHHLLNRLDTFPKDSQRWKLTEWQRESQTRARHPRDRVQSSAKNAHALNTDVCAYCAKSAGRLGARAWRYKISLGADFSAIAPD